MSTGVLDTSVFIAAESGRSLQQDMLPDEGLVTVITLAELEAGVLAAKTTDDRAARLRTLTSLTDLELLEINAAVAHEWARLRFKLAQAGRKVNVNDLWIAVIAAAQDLPIVTQDDDFDAIATHGGITVIRV
ncbi:MAG: type II toxin-antitoxin system VapC family toxin [Propionibacteriaceae bacterium]|nr:type II toxin-antitoxin system VapC family toxin [Propionibacteriaceae bacterium]